LTTKAKPNKIHLEVNLHLSNYCLND
jgi:hypothetical protein